MVTINSSIGLNVTNALKNEDNYFTINLMQTTSSGGTKSIDTSNFNITFTQIL